MLIDVLILLPVTAFLVWLYVYSAPAGLRGGRWLADRLPAGLSLLAEVATLVGLHWTLDLDGLSRNVIAVASAYLVLLTGLAIGWFLRWRRARR